MSNTTIRVVSELKEFESLREAWNSLLLKCRDDNSIYLTYEWISTWWKHFGEGTKLNILLIEKERQVIGIVPLMKTRYRMGLIKLDTLETMGSNNCNYVGLILGESKEEAITSFLAYLEEEFLKNQLILRLNWVPEGSTFLKSLKTYSCTVSETLVIREDFITTAPYLLLPTTWDEYFSSISQRRRKILRRALRALQNGHTVEFKHLTADSLEEGSSKFFDLHQVRWQSINVKGEFFNPKMKDFYREIANKFVKKGWLYFPYLSVDGEMVAAVYGFVYNQKLYCVTGARDIRYSKYSVGHLLDMYSIQDAIEKHLKEFDFLRGSEPYKFYWTKSTRKYMRVIIVKKGSLQTLYIKFLQVFFRLYELRKYRLREIYSLYWIKRREKKEKHKMGLHGKL